MVVVTTVSVSKVPSAVLIFIFPEWVIQVVLPGAFFVHELGLVGVILEKGVEVCDGIFALSKILLNLLLRSSVSIWTVRLFWKPGFPYRILR